ncbi:isochorismatase family protein [Streptomyces cavourensis]|uniref:isochorismatase family protein n=1 Tax=Streptomyces cavourensis TaxID=67258 RepID=UPI0020C9C8B6|nr:isochorismatase family protein [Streptomyces cavourensis]
MAGIAPIPPYALPERGDLPDNTARWSIDPDRAVLLVHDMQRYFLQPFAPELRGPLLANAARLRAHALATGMPVAYTAQPGSMTPEDRGLLKDFWGPGMRAEPADREVVDELTPAPGSWMLTKWRYSAFFRTDLLERMRAAGRDQLVICGVYGHVGILATAVESFTQDIETFLIADAVGDFSLDRHRMTMEYAAHRCAVVLTTKEAVG